MADGPETKIGRAALALAVADPRIVAKYKPIVLTEGRTERDSFQLNSLLIGVFPVRPKDRPTEREDIFVDVLWCPVLARPDTQASSSMEMTNELNEFRKLVLKRGNRQLKDPDDQTQTVTDGNPDFWFTRAVVPQNAQNLLIPQFVTRYKSVIDVNGTFL